MYRALWSNEILGVLCCINELFDMIFERFSLIFFSLLCAVPTAVDSWHVLPKRIDSQLHLAVEQATLNINGVLNYGSYSP